VITQPLIDAGSKDAGITARGTSRARAVSASAPLETPLTPAPGLTLSKRVQIGPAASCNAAASDLSVVEGSVVTWCFTLQNTGNVTLSGFSISDAQIGINAPNTQPSGLPATLAPGASVTVSVDRTHNASMTNSATAQGRFGSSVVTAQTSSAVLVTYPAYPVSGVVWFDIDKDGILDDREPVLPDVAVELRERGVRAASVRDARVAAAALTSGSTRTDAQGRYSFPLVRPGNYDVVAKSALKGLVPSSDSDGGTDWVVGASITSGPLEVDFASTGSAKLTGTASERSGGTIPNAKVSCTWPGLDGIAGTKDDIEFSTQADANGGYEIDGMPFGDLKCSVVDPRTGRVESFSASIDGPGEVRRDAEFSKDSPTLPRTGASGWQPLRAAVTLVLLGGFLLSLRRRRDAGES
jgi:LPXTG-motif cell wall-anchored protein